MERKVKTQVKGHRTTDGDNVSLVRVLGLRTVKEFDPILMLDSFDSVNPKDYEGGFPLHPHRGIETISYIYKGRMIHKDSLSNKDEIADGEVQWMTAGSGILHEEKLPESERMLGVQLWLNLAAKDKMTDPAYLSIKNSDIKEIPFKDGYLRLLSGEYNGEKGYQSKYLPFTYYDIHLNENSEIVLNMDEDASVMIFTLLSGVYIDDEFISEKTAVKLTKGDSLRLRTKDEAAQILYMESKELNEEVAWGGPIVMNTEEELQNAFSELSDGSFLKKSISY
jgi:redox-sensitive bicupin YhaK (pirin superfamily)